MADRFVVCVCGGRDYNNRRLAFKVLSSLRTPTLVVQGGADGGDRLARVWAKKQGIRIKTYRAKWDEHGRSAGPIRNRKMLTDAQPDLVVALPGGRGSANCVETAKAMNIPVIQVL